MVHRYFTIAWRSCSKRWSLLGLPTIKGPSVFKSRDWIDLLAKMIGWVEDEVAYNGR
jgi:hypothetical protein